MQIQCVVMPAGSIMPTKQRPRSVIRLEGLYRKLLLRYLHEKRELILVTEYPKSGASWLCQLLAQYAEMDFPRQKFPSKRQSVMHGHYLMEGKVRGPTVVFWRDPRDIMISWYFHCLYKTDKNNHKQVEFVQNTLGFKDIADIKSNLGRFISYSFNESNSPRFNLNHFYDSWGIRNDVVHSSYEALVDDPINELLRVCDELKLDNKSQLEVDEIVKANSFSAQAKRSPGEQNKASYLRKGVVGDWENHFTNESLSILEDCMEGRLEKFPRLLDKKSY